MNSTPAWHCSIRTISYPTSPGGLCCILVTPLHSLTFEYLIDFLMKGFACRRAECPKEKGIWRERAYAFPVKPERGIDA
jgi:hypothetical protein